MKKNTKINKNSLLVLFIVLFLAQILYMNTNLFACHAKSGSQELKEIDLVKEAPNAVWTSSYGRLRFGGSRDNPHGFAIYRRGLLLEDNSTAPIILETHPRWVDDGYIRGEFFIPNIQAGQHFRASIGFIKPIGTPRTNGVKVKIIFNNTTLYSSIKLYTDSLEKISIDMSKFANKSGTLILEVDTNGDSTQDWLIWKNAKIGTP